MSSLVGAPAKLIGLEVWSRFDHDASSETVGSDALFELTYLKTAAVDQSTKAVIVNGHIILTRLRP